MRRVYRPDSMMSLLCLLPPRRVDHVLQLTLFVLLYLSTITSTSMVSSSRSHMTSVAARNGCSETPNVQLDANGNLKHAPCCSGWVLQNGKCLKASRTSASKSCDSSGCPSGRICSPFGGPTCICPKGSRGVLCNKECPPGSYGWGCRRRCGCPVGVSCDPESGACDYDDDYDEENGGDSTTSSNRASNNTAGLCSFSCGLRASLGCVCNVSTDRCECPGYAIALIVVSVMTWVCVGSVIFGYYVKRRGLMGSFLDRYRQKNYKADEGGDSGLNIEVEHPVAGSRWWDYPPPISQRSSGEYPLLAPISVPDLLEISSYTSYVTRISRGSLPRSTSNSSEEDGQGDDREEEGEDEADNRHDYLNIPEFLDEGESDGEEYSQPYEHLGQLSRQNSMHSQYAMDIGNDSRDTSFIVRTWTGSKDTTSICDESSYVNESVLKWKRRFATRRTLLARQHRSFSKPRCPVAPLSSSCCDVRSATNRVNSGPSSPVCAKRVDESPKRKPTLKPKPEFIKLKMLMDIEKRKRRGSLCRTRVVKSCDNCTGLQAGTQEVSLSDLESLKDPAEDTERSSNGDRLRGNRLRYLRAALLKKGISVPETESNTDRRHLIRSSKGSNISGEEAEGTIASSDPIYENDFVRKPARRKTRLDTVRPSDAEVLKIKISNLTED